MYDITCSLTHARDLTRGNQIHNKVNNSDSRSGLLIQRDTVALVNASWARYAERFYDNCYDNSPTLPAVSVGILRPEDQPGRLMQINAIPT